MSLAIFQNLTIFTLFAFLTGRILASPAFFPVEESIVLHRRTDPVFPDSPPSCPICQQVCASRRQRCILKFAFRLQCTNIMIPNILRDSPSFYILCLTYTNLLLTHR